MSTKQSKTLETTPPWQPFKYSIFKTLWLTSLFSNIGTWMNDVTAAWLMTSLTSKPWLVALVQAATSLPVFLLALPAGALADIIDKRVYLIVLQTSMLMIASLLTIVTFLDLITPLSLLLLTFCLGIGTALSFPTWISAIPELVPKHALLAAITLNSVNINLARAIGPAIAGMIIATTGPVAVFCLNAISFLGIIISLSIWKRKHIESTLPTERLFAAIRAGIRYAWSAPPYQNVLFHAFGFPIFGVAIWALLPIVARLQLHLGALGYGFLYGSLGVGAVIGAALLSFLHHRMSVDNILLGGGLVFGVMSFLLAVSYDFYFSCLILLFAGAAWISVLSLLNAHAILAVPAWLRARGSSIFLMVFFGSMAAGSALWGAIATNFSIPIALIVAGLGLLITTLTTYPFTLTEIEEIDHTPQGIPLTNIAEYPPYEQGPVMITIEYCVEPNELRAFTRLMKEMRLTRRREGAFFWNLFHDLEHPTRFTECFMTESWVTHLRTHQHATVSDIKLQEKVNKFHKGVKKPKISHLVAYDFNKR